MGYTTDFNGRFSVKPPLNKKEIDFLTKFSRTRRMDRTKGPYYVDGKGCMGQDHEDDIISYNRPHEGQPSLWCQWIPSPGGKFIEWDGNEKFYEAEYWIKYLIEHFVGSEPLAQPELPFFKGHNINGQVDAQGEDPDDKWAIRIENGTVLLLMGEMHYTVVKEITTV